MIASQETRIDYRYSRFTRCYDNHVVLRGPMSDLRKRDLSQARRAQGSVRLAVAITLRLGRIGLGACEGAALVENRAGNARGLLASAISVQLAAPERPGNCFRCYLLTVSEIPAISTQVPDEARGLSAVVCSLRVSEVLSARTERRGAGIGA
jgi:hypothetical protein